MKTTIKVFAIAGIILGALSVLGCMNGATWEDVFYSILGGIILGGIIFVAWGIRNLVLLKSLEK